jgi:site-specific recombinase XerD
VRSTVDWESDPKQWEREKYAAAEVARKEEARREQRPDNPAADQASGFTLNQARALLEKHDRINNAAPNTVEYHDDRAGHLVRVFGGSAPLAKIDMKAFVDYTEKRCDEGGSAYTIKKEHTVFRQMLGLAKSVGCYFGNPEVFVLPGYTEDAYEPGDVWLEKVEWVNALIAHTSSNPDKHRIDRRDDMLVILNSGLRRRELLFIRPEHVNLEQRSFLVRDLSKREKKNVGQRATGLKTKSSMRSVPMTDTLLEVFRRRLRTAQPGRPLFTDWGSGNRDLKANWKRARAWLIEQAPTSRAAAELDAVLPQSLTFNDLRRTCCSLMRNAGVSKDDCAALLGHTDTRMVSLVYAHTADATLHAAIAKLPVMGLPPEALKPRKGISRRHRQRLRAESKLAKAETA